MEITARTEQFMKELNSYSRGNITNKKDLSILLQITENHKKEEVFDSLIFQAKFMYNLFTIMRRTAPDAEEYPKLSGVFKEAIEKVGTLIRTLVKEAPDDVKETFKEQYFSMSHSSLNNLINLAYDLSWVKNWRIDNNNSDD